MPVAAAQLQRENSRSDSSGLFSSPEKRSVVLGLVLVVVTLVVYNPLTRNGFVNWDDNQYLQRNSHIMAGLTWDTVRWSFSSFYQANWHPLTWISHAVDYQLFGLNAAGHHYVNVLFHASNVVLLFLLFQSATGFTWRSLMVAALFALHPVNVESVAWASERKNVLSMMFLLLALHAYGWYVRKPGVGRYLAVAVLFVFGLMSKPQVITLPFLLLVWDYWPLARFRCGDSMMGTKKPAAPARTPFWLFLEKCPLFLLCCCSAVITMKAQKAGGAIHSSATQYSFYLRLENAILSYSRYLLKAVWPSNLSPLYPHPWESIHLWQVAASALLLLVITALVLRYRQHRYFCAGWLWFLGTLVPMIGLVQVGEQFPGNFYGVNPLSTVFLDAPSDRLLA